MTLFPLLSSSSSPCVSHNNCRSSSSSRCFSSKSFSTLSRGKGGKIQNQYSTIATRATRSNDSNNNINNNSKYIEKAKMQDLLSNLERWLRENGSEMNEKCEFGFSSMMEEDNTLMIRKNTCGIFNRGSKSSSTSSSRSNICLLYTSPSPRDATLSRMPSSA